MTEASGDVVAFLRAQHEQIRDLLDRVAVNTGPARQSSFDDLREFLARHETAEEMVVRPLTRNAPDGEEVSKARFEEENESKRELAKLEVLDVDSEPFVGAFETFRNLVLSHAEAEEREEFPLLESSIDAQTLRSAREKVEKAEKRAPTHPHPSARTTAMNYIAGPFASLLDRARDAFSK